MNEMSLSVHMLIHMVMGSHFKSHVSSSQNYLVGWEMECIKGQIYKTVLFSPNLWNSKQKQHSDTSKRPTLSIWFP